MFLCVSKTGGDCQSKKKGCKRLAFVENGSGLEKELSVKENKRKEMLNTASISAVGLEMGLAVGIGAMFGSFVDKHFGTKPWGMMIGFLFGLAAAVMALIRTVQKVQKMDEEQSSENDNQ